MAGFTDATEAAVLNCYFRQTNITAPTAVWMGIFSTAPNDAGAGGTELTNGTAPGYARVDVTASFGNAATADSITSTVDILTPVSTGAWPAGDAVGFFTASTGGTAFAFSPDNLPALTGANEQHRIPAGSLTVTLD